MATWMLSPILRTCRQLHQMAISHTILWKTVSLLSQYRLPACAGADIPLVVIVNGRDHEGLWGASEAMEMDVSRVQELHILNLVSFRHRNDAAELRRRFPAARLSCLESLSISSVVTTSVKEEPISLDEAPRLKHMALQSVTFLPQSTFPHLTHLALGDIYLRNHHNITADLLSHCPNLESLAINCTHVDRPPIVPEPLSQPLALHHLRRVALQLPEFLGILARFYFSLFRPINPCPGNLPMALQILNYHFEDPSLHLGTLLVQATMGAASHLSLSMAPVPSRSSFDHAFFAISAAGPQGTFHVTSTPFHDDRRERGWDAHHGSFVNSVLDGGVHLAAVREVWITGKHLDTERHAHITAAFRTTIAALPALETVVLVVPTESGVQLAGPNLAVCPNALDHCGLLSPRLRTLRVVYGNDVNRGPLVDHLDLGRLLVQLETGAYGYFDTLLLDTKPSLAVSPADLQRLAGRFATFEHRYVDRMPTMPLPGYCVEPYAGLGGSCTWMGSLW